MKKTMLTLALLLACTLTMKGQTYTALWKQVKEAEQQDLPRSQYDLLMKIAGKAQKEHKPGQLMKAELQGARLMTEISADSLLPAVERMEKRMEAEHDVSLKTVYQVVLRRIFKENSDLERTPLEVVLTPELCRNLAAVKALDYEPLTVKGVDSRIFGDDLLSVIGYELEQYEPLHAYYVSVGNRRAALLTALELLRQQRPEGMAELKKSDYLHRVDSLVSAYGDLTECGEAAIEHFRYMDDYTYATPEEKWQYINLALDRWGSWKGMNELRNRQRQLTLPSFCASSDEMVGIPGRSMTLKLEHIRNIHQLTMRVYSVKAQGDTDLSLNGTEGYRKVKPLLTLLPVEATRQYVGKKEYEVFEDSMTLPGLPEGIYMIEMESLPATQVSRCLFSVSNVRVLMEGHPDKKTRIVVVNATTGQPLKGAHVRLMSNRKTLQTLTTDSQGEVICQSLDKRPQQVFAYTDKDKFCPPVSGFPNFSYYNNQRHVERMAVFTDRSLYRPGQTVHAAVIAYATDNGFEHRAMEGKSVTLTLHDANNKVVSEQTLTTDRFGTCAADFTLPSGLLSGMFSLHTMNGSCTFRVEEYKRPTFEVSFPEVNQHYEDGDTIQVRATARSFAGFPLQGAKVRYTVERRRAFWWWSYSRYWNFGTYGVSSNDEEVASGETVTGNDGTFVVEIPMNLPSTLYPQFYNFVCEAIVTDQAGETHSAQLSLPLGNRPTAFFVDIPEQILTDFPSKFVFHQRNAAGIDISADVRYHFDDGKWREARTNTDVSLPRLPSGLHVVEAICGTDTLKQSFTVFSLDDKRPPYKTSSWFYQSASHFPDDGRPVTIMAGSSDEDVHIVYSVFSGDRLLESGSVDKSNELVNRKLTYKEEYGNGLVLSYAWVKQGRVYTRQFNITRPLPKKQLTLEWKTFRNRLTPGQKEQWSLLVKAPASDGKMGMPVGAQLMATLYDKSLDQFDSHQWAFSPFVNLPLPSSPWLGNYWGNIFMLGEKPQSVLSLSPLTLTTLDYSIFPRMYRNLTYNRSLRRVAGAALSKTADTKVFEGLAMSEPPILVAAQREQTLGHVEDALQGRVVGLDVVDNVSEQETESVYVRENLQETAFFYSQLMVDSTGCVTLDFTLPESLTTWRFMGLAHTPDLCYGLIDGETVAQKDVMIQPNMPRFVREGDEATVSARIFNLSGRTIRGTARMQLVDPETDKVVYESARPFTLDADSSSAVVFPLSSQSTSLLICRVTANGQGFSDGEQHYLPILPATERVTVTVPFTQHGAGTKIIDLATLFPKSAANSKLTIEYTNNPAWLMIQALPAVGHPNDDCAICQATSLYANSLGKFIIDQVPQAKQVFEQWRREPQDNQTASLASQLQKNQELKDLLLQATPWVMDADRETEQRQRLADFFDDNLMSQRLSSATSKLQSLQRSDGAWSWWPDMSGSTYMTMTISEMLVRLQTMTGTPQPMLDGAFKFMGREMVSLVQEMKKEEKKGNRQLFPSHTVLQWLYVCKLDGRPLPSSVQAANDYLISLLKKETKNQGIYEKALSSVILDSPLYIKSLKEYTVYSEEMGRYYDTPCAGYSWRDYRIPTQVAVIEAIQRLTPDDQQTLSEMRRWLLQQKRTQAWDTPLNSVDAVYAFLSPMGPSGPTSLMSPLAPVLTIDGKAVETSKSTAGLGYVKSASVYHGAKSLSVQKHGEGTSWGAVYAQFMQPTADIKDNGSGITVRRELLDEDHAPLATLHPPLKVGSRVTVRLTIQSERDLDFVQLQDKRAACLEPVKQLSGYNWQGGYYCAPRDNTTDYFFDRLPKGKHVIETEYFIDRPGQYETGTCTVQCAYAPEYRGTTHSQTIKAE